MFGLRRFGMLMVCLVFCSRWLRVCGAHATYGHPSLARICILRYGSLVPQLSMFVNSDCLVPLANALMVSSSLARNDVASVQDPESDQASSWQKYI